jgi:hypothetical protein
MKIRNQNPKGGTELQFEYLEKHVDKNLLDQVQICTSVPGLVTLLIITSMTGMFLIHTGHMKNLEIILIYLQTDV